MFAFRYLSREASDPERSAFTAAYRILAPLQMNVTTLCFRIFENLTRHAGCGATLRRGEEEFISTKIRARERTSERALFSINFDWRAKDNRIVVRENVDFALRKIRFKADRKRKRKYENITLYDRVIHRVEPTSRESSQRTRRFTIRFTERSFGSTNVRIL